MKNLFGKFSKRQRSICVELIKSFFELETKIIIKYSNYCMDNELNHNLKRERNEEPQSLVHKKYRKIVN